jgi:protein-ribulosamine 3-kinase
LTQPTQDPSVKRLLRADLRIPIEAAVTAYLGRGWQVTRAEGKTDEASHPAAILADGAYAVFVKLGEGDLAVDQLTQEAAGLRLLTERSGVLTPEVITVVQVESGALLVLEAVQVIDREPLHWRQIGHALARLHAIKGERFGLETHCYWGSFYQDNRPLVDWPEFFWQRRIEPWLQAGVDSGRLPTTLITQVEKVGRRLEELCGPTVQPTLLHGDAHQNNFLSTAQGPVLIDPAVYYGHPEMDLAYVDFFAPVPDELFAGYRELAPIEPGFAERRDLWLIHAWLAMVAVDGPQHVEMLNAALSSYV